MYGKETGFDDVECVQPALVNTIADLRFRKSW